MYNHAILTVLLCSHVVAAAAADIDIDQSLIDLPAPVKATIQRESTGQSIGVIERGTRDGRAVYYIRIESLDGINKHLTIGGDGVVMKIMDYPAVNEAIPTSSSVLVATAEPAVASWEATATSVRKTMENYRSDELTLNQIPPLPRAALEGLAAGHRLQNIHASATGRGMIYRADISQPEGAKRMIAVGDNGMSSSEP